MTPKAWLKKLTSKRQFRNPLAMGIAALAALFLSLAIAFWGETGLHVRRPGQVAAGSVVPQRDDMLFVVPYRVERLPIAGGLPKVPTWRALFHFFLLENTLMDASLLVYQKENGINAKPDDRLPEGEDVNIYLRRIN